MAEYYISQVIAFLFAFPFSVQEEKNFTFPFREFPWPPQYNKSVYQKKAHFFGAGGVLVVLVGLSLLSSWDYPVLWPFLLQYLFVFVTTGLIYWQAFDSGYGVSINKGLFYLGDTAGSDSWWVKRFGAKAGKLKFAIFITGIVILNALYLIIKP